MYMFEQATQGVKMENTNRNLKQKIRHELHQYLLYTVFLMLLFFAFTSYERILLDKYEDFYIPYGYCVIKALIMAKVIMIGDAINIGKRFSNQPLIIIVIYKTIVFCLFMLLLMVIETLTKGMIEGRSFQQTYEIFSTHLVIDIAQTVIMFFIFILFFSVLETSRVLGGTTLRDIFFKSADKRLIS